MAGKFCKGTMVNFLPLAPQDIKENMSFKIKVTVFPVNKTESTSSYHMSRRLLIS